MTPSPSLSRVPRSTPLVFHPSIHASVVRLHLLMTAVAAAAIVLALAGLVLNAPEVALP